MCYFVSYIVTESRVYHYPGVDSHDEIIKLAGLRDGVGGGNFVRCEIKPDWTDWADVSKWRFRTDQDVRPDWYSEADAEQQGRIIAQRIVDSGDWRVGGSLYLSGCTGLSALPDNQNVGGGLDLRGCTGLTALPDGLRVGEWLDLRGCTGLTALPDGLSVGGWLDLTGCTGLTALPDGLRVGGWLDLTSCTGLTAEQIAEARKKHKVVL
jgi:hypothetical protein